MENPLFLVPSKAPSNSKLLFIEMFWNFKIWKSKRSLLHAQVNRLELYHHVKWEEMQCVLPPQRKKRFVKLNYCSKKFKNTLILPSSEFLLNEKERIATFHPCKHHVLYIFLIEKYMIEYLKETIIILLKKQKEKI